MPRRIGLDLDGVLIDHTANKLAVAVRFGFELEPWQVNSNFLKNLLPPKEYKDLQEEVYGRMTLDAPPVDGVLEHLPELDGELFLISRRSPKSIRFAQQWLGARGLFDYIPAERMVFCESKADKRAICDRLGIVAYVDDQLDVLKLLSPKTKRILMDSQNIAHKLQMEEGFHIAPGWSHVPKLVATPLHAS